MDEPGAIDDEGRGAPGDAPTRVLGGGPRAGSAAASQGRGAGSRAPGLTAVEVAERGELPRMRAFHWFGLGISGGAVLLSALIGGDPTARVIFWFGAAVLGACNLALLWLIERSERYDGPDFSMLWMLSACALQTAAYYFGPFSAVVAFELVGVLVIALGLDRWTALATTAICMGGHAALALPMALGWLDDPGVLSSRAADRGQLVVGELLILGVLAGGYVVGRRARATSSAALAELQQAVQVIGDQQQVLAEHADAARAHRAGEGRFSGHLVGGFRLGPLLGRGAMGDVYEALREEGGPPAEAAVKLLNARATASPALVERFHRELEVAARMRSPHVVRILAVSGPASPVPFLAMERLRGVDLAARLRDEARLPSDELAVLLEHVARGLEDARQAGIVHRDLKPHNLFLHDGATWKILDFGIARLLDGEGTLTGEGVIGTPQYMAPEQARGEAVDHRADVYALGAVAYRCLTGRSPFKGADLAALVYQVVHQAPARPGLLGRVPPEVEDVLAVAMAKDPRQRFPTATAFAQAFVQARRGRRPGLAVPRGAWAGPGA